MLTYKNLLLIETDVHKTWYQYKGEKLFAQFMTYSHSQESIKFLITKL